MAPEIRLQIYATFLKKPREFNRKIYLCFIDYAKAFDCVRHSKLWTAMREMGVPDHLIKLISNLYDNQQACVRTDKGDTDWFNIGQGVRQGCILSPALFNLYAEYIMRRALSDWIEVCLLEVAESAI
jgi:hypothetical protein